MIDDITIRRLDAAGMDARIAGLSDVVVDCVAGGASVSFMAPFGRDRADSFWHGVRERVAAGLTHLFVAERNGAVVGTVQLVLGLPENQPHRGDVAKMLVHRDARNRGIGDRLLGAAEAFARDSGKTLLVLDTASEEAERLYRRRGWIEVGRVPGYALFPDGRPCDTIFFYKQLTPVGRTP